MVNKIRHHYVPVGLSKNFCLEDKRLYLYDLLNKQITPSAPKDAFLKKKLHSIVGDTGKVDHNLIEDEFMQIESIGIKGGMTRSGTETRVKEFMLPSVLASEVFVMA